MAAKLRGMISNVPFEMSTEEVKGESEGRMVIGARRRQASKGGTRSDNVIAANFGCFNCRVK